MLSVMVTTPVGGDMGDDDILSGSGGIGCDGDAGVDDIGSDGGGTGVI